MFDFFCWKLFGKISKIKQNIYIYLTQRTLKTCKNLFCVSSLRWCHSNVTVMSQRCHQSRYSSGTTNRRCQGEKVRLKGKVAKLHCGKCRISGWTTERCLGLFGPRVDVSSQRPPKKSGRLSNAARQWLTNARTDCDIRFRVPVNHLVPPDSRPGGLAKIFKIKCRMCPRKDKLKSHVGGSILIIPNTRTLRN